MPDPFVPVPGVTQVEMRYTKGNQQCENVYHFTGLAPTKAATDTAAAWLVNVWETADARLLRGADCSWTGITFRDMSSQDGAIFTPQPSGPFAGTGAGVALPNSVTVAIKHSTGLGGRSFRGRSYWIGLTESMINANVLGANISGQLVTVMNALLSSAAQTNVGNLVVVSKRHNKQPRVTGISTPVIGFSCDETIDNQRRRLPGRGK